MPIDSDSHEPPKFLIYQAYYSLITNQFSILIRNFPVLRWASWNNHKSFWLVKEDLIQALRDVGYRHVWETFDHLDDPRTDDYTRRHDRGFFHRSEVTTPFDEVNWIKEKETCG